MRPSRLSAPLRTATTLVALASIAVLAAAALAGCGGPSLTDPLDIVTRSENAMASVRSFHFQADATGQMVLGVEPGPTETPAAGGSAAPPAASASAAPAATAASGTVSLAGSTASGDVDLAAQSAHVTGQLPGVAGLGGEVIIVDGVAYTRGTRDAGYHVGDPSSLAFNPADPSGGPSILRAILSMAAEPRMAAKFVGAESCPEGSCYHIAVSITKDAANQQFGGGGIAFGEGKIDLWILADSFRVADVEFTSSDPQAGTFWGRILFSQYGKTVSIAPPPPAQLLPAGQ